MKKQTNQSNLHFFIFYCSQEKFQVKMEKEFEAHDPDRHLKRIHKVVGVSGRIQSLATRRRKSIRLETKEEKQERILVRLLIN